MRRAPLPPVDEAARVPVLPRATALGATRRVPPRVRRCPPSQSTSTDCSIAFSRCRASTRGRTRICAPAPREWSTIWKRARTVRRRSIAIHCAIIATFHSSPASPTSTSAPTGTSCSIARQPAVVDAVVAAVQQGMARRSSLWMRIVRRPRRARVVSTPNYARTSIRSRSSSRSSTKRGATSATICTCRTSTARIGRRSRRCTARCCRT